MPENIGRELEKKLQFKLSMGEDPAHAENEVQSQLSSFIKKHSVNPCGLLPIVDAFNGAAAKDRIDAVALIDANEVLITGKESAKSPSLIQNTDLSPVIDRLSCSGRELMGNP